MGKLLLLLRLEGPLQSWGLRSRWDVRDTGEEPSKSGIVGLLGCALGYPVGDPRLEELDAQLRMGVRVEHPGTRLVDFQTITGVMPTASGGVRGSPDDPATVISPRAYLQDAAFLVVLDGPDEVLRRCAAALAAPRWPLYLGRKSCIPTRPVLEGLTDAYSSIEEALERHPWDWGGRQTLKEPPSTLRIVVEDPAGEAIRPDRIRVNPARMYANRTVRVGHVPFPGEAPQGEGGTTACT